ncbi:hypothetical protein D3C71_1932530 [compost metagenome]
MLIFIGTGQVVDLVTQHRHGPVEPAVLGQVEAQVLGMTPGAALQPADIDSIIGVTETVDVVGNHADVDHERIRQIPIHRCRSSLPRDAPAGTERVES